MQPDPSHPNKRAVARAGGPDPAPELGGAETTEAIFAVADETLATAEEWVSGPVEIWTARFLDSEPTQTARRDLFAALNAADLDRDELIAVARAVLGVRAKTRAEALRDLEIWYWDRVRGHGEADRIRAGYEPAED